MFESLIDWMEYMEELQNDELEQSELPPRRLKKKIENTDTDSREGRIVRKKQLKFHHILSSFLVVVFLPIPILFVFSVYRPDLVPFFEKDEVVVQSNFETIKMDEKKKQVDVIEEKDDEVIEDTKQDETDIVEENVRDEENYEYYTVQEGDTLYHISMEYFGDRSGEDIIMNENELSSRELVVGTVLKIPKNKDM